MLMCLVLGAATTAAVALGCALRDAGARHLKVILPPRMVALPDGSVVGLEYNNETAFIGVRRHRFTSADLPGAWRNFGEWSERGGARFARPTGERLLALANRAQLRAAIADAAIQWPEAKSPETVFEMARAAGLGELADRLEERLGESGGEAAAATGVPGVDLQVRVTVAEAGWPFYAMRGTQWETIVRPRLTPTVRDRYAVTMRGRVVPWGIAPAGFIADMLFWAAVWLGAQFATDRVRRHFRRGRDRCGGCGYDLRGAVTDRCPECGETTAPRGTPGRRIPASPAQ
jgi:hypothetical protein